MSLVVPLLVDDMADSLVNRLHASGTAGNVTVKQSWSGTSSSKESTSASRNWGKLGSMSVLLGKTV